MSLRSRLLALAVTLVYCALHTIPYICFAKYNRKVQISAILPELVRGAPEDSARKSPFADDSWHASNIIDRSAITVVAQIITHIIRLPARWQLCSDFIYQEHLKGAVC